MPELPEVETVARAIAAEITGSRIRNVVLNRNKIRLPIPSDFIALTKDFVVKKVSRRAKYIFIELSSGQTMVIHLGMSGKITVSSDYIFKKHDHVVFYFDSGKVMAYNDARRFGFVSLLKDIDLSMLGVDALSDSFNSAYLKDKIHNRNSPIKTLMLDQSVVGGIGNIYIIEALFKSHINPLKKAGLLTEDEIASLIKNLKDILLSSIDAGGTTLRDYRRVSGEKGSFQNNLRIYGREGKPCPVCAGSIVRIVQSGRSTFYCPQCQKM